MLHFTSNIFLFSKTKQSMRNVGNTVDPDRLQITIWGMRIACWIFKAKNAHSCYVILINSPWQLWSHERASLLCL